MSSFNSLPRKTRKEVKEFLEHINHLGDYWTKANVPEDQKVHGALFSVLVLLDGGSGDFSGFKLINKATKTDLSIGYLHEIKDKFG